MLKEENRTKQQDKKPNKNNQFKKLVALRKKKGLIRAEKHIQLFEGAENRGFEMGFKMAGVTKAKGGANQIPKSYR